MRTRAKPPTKATAATAVTTVASTFSLANPAAPATAVSTMRMIAHSRLKVEAKNPRMNRTTERASVLNARICAIFDGKPGLGGFGAVYAC
ncbi:hypothetical protein GCM10010528_06980 [Gordonia defluvii]|uniref:Secreted protein n=1 Tax=Gordonia defluvii TaxID=283718 RepID=A0ABP6KZC8_9ACTN